MVRGNRGRPLLVTSGLGQAGELLNGLARLEGGKVKAELDKGGKRTATERVLEKTHCKKLILLLSLSLIREKSKTYLTWIFPPTN